MEENVLVFNYSDLRCFVDCFKCPTKFYYNCITFDNFYDFIGYSHLDFLTKKLFAVNFRIESNEFETFVLIKVYIFDKVNL